MQGRTLPVCDHLDTALQAMVKTSLTMAINDARPFLSWISYDAYPRDEIGAHSSPTTMPLPQSSVEDAHLKR